MKARHPIIHEALLNVGHRQTRNRGTVGGSLCHLDPSAEIPTIALALDATVTAAGPNGKRDIPIAEFPVDYMTTAVQPDEILVEIRFPAWPKGHGYGFVEFARRHGDFAIASAAALLEEDASGKIKRVSLTIGGVSKTPVRMPQCRESAPRPDRVGRRLPRRLRGMPQARSARRRARARELPSASRHRHVAPRADGRA